MVAIDVWTIGNDGRNRRLANHDGQNRYIAIHSGQNRCSTLGFREIRIRRSLVFAYFFSGHCVVLSFHLRLLVTLYVYDNDICKEQLTRNTQLKGLRFH